MTEPEFPPLSLRVPTGPELDEIVMPAFFDWMRTGRLEVRYLAAAPRLRVSFFWALMPPAAVGVAVALYFAVYGGWCVPGGARQFFQWADQIVGGGPLDPAIAQRDVGYPLLLVLSGWPWTHSLYGIVAIQLGFSALMPVLVTLALLPFNRFGAMLTGVAAALSLGPVYYAKMIHHDEAYVFWVLATATALSAFIATKRYRYLYLFAGVCLLATLTRPAGMLLFPVLLGLAWWYGDWRSPHFVVAGLLFAAAIIGYRDYRHWLFGEAGYTGAQVFYNPYMNARDYGVRLDPRGGPALIRLDADLRAALARPEFLADHRAIEPPDFAAWMFAGDIAERVWAEPNWEYFTLLCDAEAADRVLLDAGMELAAAHPLMTARYTLRNLWLFLVNPGWQHSRYNVQRLNYGGLDFLPAINGPPDRYERAVLGEAATDLTPARIPEWLVVSWKAACKLGVPLGMLLVAAAWLRISATRVSAPLVAAFAVVTLLILYEAAVSSVFAEPSYRYANFIITLRVLASGFAAVVLLGERHG